jgi:protein TonB
MFEQALAGEHAHRAWPTLAGMAAEAALMAAAVMVPMVSPQALPNYRMLARIFIPTSPPPPPPPGSPLRQPARPAGLRTPWRDNVLVAPVSMPARPQFLEDPPDAGGPVGSGAGVPGGVEHGVPGGLATQILTDSTRITPPPRIAPPATPKTAPPPKAAAQITRIKVGGLVQEALLIRRVMPVYPRLALAARVSGDVHLLGVIATDGTVKELRVVSGHPLLAPAALDAVRQFVYRPTYLNGDPVEVAAPIVVRFRME